MLTFNSLRPVWRWWSRGLSVALVVGLGFGPAAGAAAAPVPSLPALALARPPAVLDTISPATAAQLAAAMDVPPADVLAADLMGSDPLGVGVSDASLGIWFPTGTDNTFAILSTGEAMSATLPNSIGNLSGLLGGINNSSGRDLVRLHLQLAVPADRNCLSFEFAYYSEEFPEYVGTNFNDAFTTQLGNSSLTISGTLVLAPGNFALDSQGHQVSVNTVFGVFAPTATTYDGATPLLRATTPVTPSANIDLYFSITDLGDSAYDSAVFMDGFRWTQADTCTGGIVATGLVYLPIALK